MTKLGYDPAAGNTSTQAERHGPDSGQYHHISADPVLAAKAGGGRGATIVPRATSLGGSSVRRAAREIKVHLTQNGTTDEVVTIRLDKLDKAALAQAMALAKSPQDVWRRLAADQQLLEKQASLPVPTPVEQPHTMSTQLPPQTQPMIQWPWDNSNPSSGAPTWPAPAAPVAPPPPAVDPTTQAQMQFLMQQVAALTQIVQQRNEQPAPQPAPRPAPTPAPVKDVAEQNPLDAVNLGYLGYPGPKEPEHQVIFNWGPLGLQAGYYHAVKVTNDIVTLEFDTRSRTQQYMPVKSDSPVSIVVINQREHTQKPLNVYVSGLQFRVGCLDICVLVVDDTAKEPAPALGDSVHKPVTLNDLIEGVVPDELPETAHGKVRGYQ